jgi:hypothetical protein
VNEEEYDSALAQVEQEDNVRQIEEENEINEEVVEEVDWNRMPLVC